MAFIVASVSGDCDFVYLIDGKLRKIEKPKKKKIKHVQFTKFVDNEIKHKLDNNLYLLDADIRKALEAYQS
jgi:ribosomal protein L14E/L6E/L27E